MSDNEFEISKEEEELLHKISSARESLRECDEYMQKSKARSVAMGIDLTSLELNLYLKKLFLSSHHNLGDDQYNWLTDELMSKINSILKVVEERFGRNKSKPEFAKKTEH